MILKISRGVWFVSTFATLGVLLTVYASMPEQVFLYQQGLDYFSVSREAFFYIALGLLTLVNAMVYVVRGLFEREENFRAWFHGLIITLNIFLVISLLFLGAFNSTEKFNFARVGVTIYGSVGLIVIWACAWPIFSVIRKFSPKQSV